MNDSLENIFIHGRTRIAVQARCYICDYDKTKAIEVNRDTDSDLETIIKENKLNVFKKHKHSTIHFAYHIF